VGLLWAVGLVVVGACEVVVVLEGDASFEEDVVPGAGGVVVGAEEVLDVPEVFVEAEHEVAGRLVLGERGVVCEALLELVDVVLEGVEEAAVRVGVPVWRGVGCAEGVEEVL